MTCREARRLLSPYLDSELDPGQTFEVGIHLQECQTCRERFAAEREVERAVIQRVQNDAMPADLWNTIQQRVLSARHRTGRGSWYKPGVLRETPRLRFGLYWGGITALAACLLIAVIAGRRTLTPPSASGADAWVVTQFRAQDAASADVADPDVAEVLARSAQEAFHRQIRMNMAAEATQGHQLELLNVTLDADSDRRTLLVRLRCCGQPVLVAISSAASPGPLADMARVASGDSQLPFRVDDLKVAAWQAGDLVIAAVSRHPVAQLEKAFRVTMS